MNAIHTDSLTKYYGKTRGIINLNLTVEEGECFGFIGPNGAGKSTTIRTLLGLIFPTSGSAAVLGKDIVKEKEAILRDVGYLPSEAMFYPGMRVRDVLKLSASLRKKDCAQEASVLCERLQLDPSRKVDELSFGNRKKVAIVCALQANPPLLVLDEPTGGLDPLMQHAFFEIISESLSLAGKSICPATLKIPFNAPQMKKVRLAPCHIPLTNSTTNILMYFLTVPRLLPPRGMYI